MHAPAHPGQSPFPEQSRGGTLTSRLILLGVAGVAVWAGLLWKLSIDWSTNAQYQFGFFIPLFIGVLLKRRWEARPAPGGSDGGAVLTGAAFLLLLAILPIRLVAEANPDWRPLNWVYAGLVIILTLLPVQLAGGDRWTLHFLTPLLLVLFAIPWPLAIEQGVIQWLTRCVTGASTELLNWIGIPAVQKGNLIELPTGVVGVNQACSGIRSLAGTLMSAFFLGEYFRLHWGYRTALLLCGVAAAFVLNIVRAVLLAVFHAQGVGNDFESWHDTTGLVIFALSFAVLWLAASRMAADDAAMPVKRSDGGARRLAHVAPVWVLAGAVLWTGIVEVSKEAWFRFREREIVPGAVWRVAFPEGSPHFRQQEVPEEVESILRFSEAATGNLNEPGKYPWSLYFLRWAPGRTSAQLAVMHRPEICLPATGMRFQGPTAPITVDVHGVPMHFHGTVFHQGERPVYVYRCLSEDNVLSERLLSQNFDMSVRGRLASTWHGRRNLGQRLVQVVVSGAPSEAAAREDLRKRVGKLIAVAKPAPVQSS